MREKKTYVCAKYVNKEHTRRSASSAALKRQSQKRILTARFKQELETLRHEVTLDLS